MEELNHYGYDLSSTYHVPNTVAYSLNLYVKMNSIAQVCEADVLVPSFDGLDIVSAGPYWNLGSLPSELIPKHWT